MKNLKLSIMMNTLMCLSVISAQAQQSFDWDEYGIGFSVASDYRLIENNSEIFSAVSRDGEMGISIEPWIDGDVNMDDLYDLTLDLARDLNYYDAFIEGDYFQNGDFRGYYIMTAPASYDDFDYLVFALMLDVESDTNLIVSIGYDEGNYDEAADMLLSIYAYD